MNLGRPTIDVGRFEEAVEFLNNFGDLIDDCKLAFYDINEIMSKNILNHLNDKASKTLKSLELYNCYGSILNGMIKPFEQVTSLKISAPEEPIKQKISQFFPKLQKFYVTLWTKVSDWSFNDLISLELSKQDQESESKIADLIKRSPKLKFLKFEWQNRDILKEASEYLPESVQIWIDDNENQNQQENIYLSTVKKLEVFTFEKDVTLSPFNFNQLEQFTLKMNARGFGCIPQSNRNDLSQEWKSFITSKVNPNLKTLKLATRTITAENIEFVLKTLPRLEAVTFDVMYSPTTFPHLNDWNVSTETIEDPFSESTAFKLTKR